jgi:FAD/FMN-containing dehydrogenase
MTSPAFKTDLRAIVGEQGLLEGAAVRERAALLWHGRVDAELLVRPRSTAQVSQVLALCHARGQAVVTHGGLTGLVNGADADCGDLVLSLESMNAIERVDVPGRSMRVQAGAKLGNVQREAETHGMVFPLDLGARDSATVGGNISTNAGGLRVLRYGMMRNLVLGIEAVLADGTVLTSLNRMLKNNAGYDLKQLFIGSEGTLGVVTRAELRCPHSTPWSTCWAGWIPGSAVNWPPSRPCGATTTTTTRRRRRRMRRRWRAARRSTPSPRPWAVIRSPIARAWKPCWAKRSRRAWSVT